MTDNLAARVTLSLPYRENRNEDQVQDWSHQVLHLEKSSLFSQFLLLYHQAFYRVFQHLSLSFFQVQRQIIQLTQALSFQRHHYGKNNAG